MTTQLLDGPGRTLECIHPKFMVDLVQAKSQVIIEKGELGRHKQVKIIHPQQIPSGVDALTH